MHKLGNFLIRRAIVEIESILSNINESDNIPNYYIFITVRGVSEYRLKRALYRYA